MAAVCCQLLRLRLDGCIVCTVNRVLKKLTGWQWASSSAHVLKNHSSDFTLSIFIAFLASSKGRWGNRVWCMCYLHNLSVCTFPYHFLAIGKVLILVPYSWLFRLIISSVMVQKWSCLILWTSYCVLEVTLFSTISQHALVLDSESGQKVCVIFM